MVQLIAQLSPSCCILSVSSIWIVHAGKQQMYKAGPCPGVCNVKEVPMEQRGWAGGEHSSCCLFWGNKTSGMAEHRFLPVSSICKGISSAGHQRKLPGWWESLLWQKMVCNTQTTWGLRWKLDSWGYVCTHAFHAWLSAGWFFIYLCLIFMGLFRKFYKAINN